MASERGRKHLAKPIRQAEKAMPEGGREHIGIELFGLVEKHQGKGFISDGVDVIPEAEMARLVRDAFLPHSRMAVRKMVAWLRKYEHLIAEDSTDAR